MAFQIELTYLSVIAEWMGKENEKSQDAFSILAPSAPQENSIEHFIDLYDLFWRLKSSYYVFG